jgi:hypothetical protein
MAAIVGPGTRETAQDEERWTLRELVVVVATLVVVLSAIAALVLRMSSAAAL